VAGTVDDEDDDHEGEVHLVLEGSTWTLTADSYVTSVEADGASTIDVNGYTLYVNGVAQ
jgi:hypothetical protein